MDGEYCDVGMKTRESSRTRRSGDPDGGTRGKVNLGSEWRGFTFRAL